MINYLLISSIYYIYYYKKYKQMQASYRLHEIKPHTHKSVGYFIRDIIAFKIF